MYICICIEIAITVKGFYGRYTSYRIYLTTAFNGKIE